MSNLNRAALAAYTSGVLRARAEYDPNPTRASFEYGNPDKPQPRAKFTDDVKADAVAAVAAGEMQRDVAERIGASANTVSRWVTAAHRGEL